MNKKYLFHLIAFLCFQSVESQPYLELLQDGETSLEKIELVADRYFKKVGTDNNDYKFYQRWLYGAKMEADEQNILTPNDYNLIGFLDNKSQALNQAENTYKYNKKIERYALV